MNEVKDLLETQSLSEGPLFKCSDVEERPKIAPWVAEHMTIADIDHIKRYVSSVDQIDRTYSHFDEPRKTFGTILSVDVSEFALFRCLGFHITEEVGFQNLPTVFFFNSFFSPSTQVSIDDDFVRFHLSNKPLSRPFFQSLPTGNYMYVLPFLHSNFDLGHICITVFCIVLI